MPRHAISERRLSSFATLSDAIVHTRIHCHAIRADAAAAAACRHAEDYYHYQSRYYADAIIATIRYHVAAAIKIALLFSRRHTSSAIIA